MSEQISRERQEAMQQVGRACSEAMGNLAAALTTFSNAWHTERLRLARQRAITKATPARREG